MYSALDEVAKISARPGAQEAPSLRPALTLLAYSLEWNNAVRGRVAAAAAAEEGALRAAAAELRRCAETNLWTARAGPMLTAFSGITQVVPG